MALTDRDRRLYARQLLLAEIGEHGQERLLAATLRLDPSADPRARDAASHGLTRAGVAISNGAEHAVPCPDTATVEQVAGQPLLGEAAALLCGSFAAVEALKALVGAGRAASFPSQLTLTAEDT